MAPQAELAQTDAVSATTAAAEQPHRDLQPQIDRQALADRLRHEGASDLAKHLDACGHLLPLTCTNCGNPRATETRCRKRWCPVCAPLVARTRLQRWNAAVLAMQWPLFVTLTRSNSADPESLRELRKAWAKFRRRKLIRDRVQGGVASLEITNNGNDFHPHLHAMIDCRWLALHTREPKRGDDRETVAELCRSAKGELTRAWADQLGQPTAIVDACRVTGGAATAYVLKYATKPAELLAMKTDLAPLIRVLRKTRLISGFGNLHPLPAVDAEERPGTACECCGEAKAWIPSDLLRGIFPALYDADRRVGKYATTKPRNS